MKKFFSKFLKDTRGVVMMEYIILGCFAVAVTVVAVLALSKVYQNGLVTMGYATLGNTVAAVDQNNIAEGNFTSDISEAATYASDLSNGATTAGEAVDFEIYPAP